LPKSQKINLNWNKTFQLLIRFVWALPSSYSFGMDLEENFQGLHVTVGNKVNNIFKPLKYLVM